MKIGEIVQLKSGGPIMTVIKIDDVSHITCMWYAELAEEFRTHVFAQTMLDEVEIDDEDED